MATDGEYNETVHSAYLQVLVNIIQAINGVKDKNFDDSNDGSKLTKLQRKRLRSAMG